MKKILSILTALLLGANAFAAAPADYTDVDQGVYTIRSIDYKGNTYPGEEHIQGVAILAISAQGEEAYFWASYCKPTDWWGYGYLCINNFDVFKTTVAMLMTAKSTNQKIRVLGNTASLNIHGITLGEDNLSE